MASEFSHAIVALAMGQAFQRHVVNRRVLLLGVVCSIIPDVDVIGFHYGIQYGDVWGHRGLTHSILFAALLSGVMVAWWHRLKSSMATAGVVLYFFLCTVSHGVLDALTNGGLGVAFFSPFDTARYFFGYRPIVVSPIGIGEFFSEDAARVLASEAVWIWLPSWTVFVVLRVLQKGWAGTRAGDPSQPE